MKLQTEIKLDLHTDKVIKAIGAAATTRMHKAVIAVRNETLDTLRGPRSGRTYYVPGTRRTYTASSPGQPPAVATSDLLNSIETTVKGEGSEIIGTVGTKLPYGKMLEFGTRNMAPRPWLKPTLDKSISMIKEIFSGKWL